MRFKVRFALPVAIGGFLVLASSLVAQDKKSTAGPTRAEKLPKPHAVEKKGQAFVRKHDGPSAKDPVHNFWITSNGGFHMTASTGKSIYMFPAASNPPDPEYYYDTTWSFVTDAAIFDQGSGTIYVGWTYKEDGSQPDFYMFFGMQPINGKYPVFYSYDNLNFFQYDWAN
jgi:hypothetical protein